MGERIGRCGVVPIGGMVRVMKGAGGAHVEGVETCGSVWGCPVCAAKIAERRRGEVETLCREHKAGGGSLYMAAFTMPHDRFQECGELKEAIAGAWRKVCAGRRWQHWRRVLGLHYTRSLEVTHGGNGWHPHLHCLFYVTGAADRAVIDQFSEWLFERWQSAVDRLGYGMPTRRVWRFEPVEHTEAAGDYVAKWGADSEIARGVLKQGRGGKSPWQLLQEAAGGDRRAAALFRAYYLAFKGARQLTHSRGLKSLYGLDDVTDDEAAAADAESETAGTLTKVEYRAVRRAGMLCRVLELAEQNSWREVLIYIDKRLRVINWQHCSERATEAIHEGRAGTGRR
ncbi:MAG: protein rep [Thalassobaculaceae bacterium]